MNEKDIQILEVRLGIVLPDSYKVALRECLFDKDSAGTFMLNDDVEWLISGNDKLAISRYRKTPLLINGNLFGNLFKIGTDGSELEYWIDLKAKEPSIFEYEIETGKAALFAATMEEYISKIKEIDRQVDEEEAAGEERVRKIPEWRRNLNFYLPAILAVIFCFTVLPLIVFCISRLWKWLMHCIR